MGDGKNPEMDFMILHHLKKKKIRVIWRSLRENLKFSK